LDGRWYKRRDDPNVLWVFFEDLKEDLDKQVKRIADFMGVPASRVSGAVQQSTFKFMSSRRAHTHACCQGTLA